MNIPAIQSNLILLSLFRSAWKVIDISSQIRIVLVQLFMKMFPVRFWFSIRFHILLGWITTLYGVSWLKEHLKISSSRSCLVISDDRISVKHYNEEPWKWRLPTIDRGQLFNVSILEFIIAISPKMYWDGLCSLKRSIVYWSCRTVLVAGRNLIVVKVAWEKPTMETEVDFALFIVFSFTL